MTNIKKLQNRAYEVRDSLYEYRQQASNIYKLRISIQPLTFTYANYIDRFIIDSDNRKQLHSIAYDYKSANSLSFYTDGSLQ